MSSILTSPFTILCAPILLLSFCALQLIMSSSTSNPALPSPTVNRKFPLPCWTHDETMALIGAYRDRWIALRQGYLRTVDWDAVASTVAKKCGEVTLPKSSDQCRHKVEKLRQRYRAEKQRCVEFPGKFFSAWIFFKALSFLDDGLAQSKKRVRVMEEKAADPVPEVSYGDRDEGFFLTALGDRKFTIDLKNIGKGEEEIQNPNFGIRRNIPFPTEHSLEQRMRKYARAEMNSRSFNRNDDLYKGFIRSDRIGTPPGFASRSLVFNVDDDGGLNFSGGVSEKLHSSMKNVNCDTPTKRKNSHENTLNSGERTDPVAEMAESVRVLVDGLLKMEKMRMEMAVEFEKVRMEMELKRNEMMMESQRRIVEAFMEASEIDK